MATEEKRQAKLLAVNPQMENGAHGKFNDLFKFIVVFDNGDTGTAFAKTEIAPWKTGQSKGYTKKSGSGKQGNWTSISFDKEGDSGGGNTGNGNRGGEDFRKSKQERITELKVQSVVACSNLFQRAGAITPEFREALTEINTLTGIDGLIDGNVTEPVKPALKVLTDDAKVTMTAYVSSKETAKIATVIHSMRDYEITHEQILEIIQGIIKPF